MGWGLRPVGERFGMGSGERGSQVRREIDDGRKRNGGEKAIEWISGDSGKNDEK